MAISDQIIRLQSAKIDMKTAIESFNINIPNNAKLDTYDDYIRLISMDANAASKDILNGKTAYVGGQKINGTALSIATSANNAKILNGFTAYDSNGQLLTGNAFGNATNATNSSLLKGHTAYLNNGVWLNGTAFGSVTNATNAVILNGYTAYLNNGFYLQGTALGNTTNALNNHILKGYTAYNSHGGWLVGTAFGNATSATNAQIVAGQSAYLNNGMWLNGTMSNYAGQRQNASNTSVSSSYVTLNVPANGYYTTASRVRCPIGYVLAEGTVTATTTTITISGLNFEPNNVMMFCELDMDITDTTDGVQKIVSVMALDADSYPYYVCGRYRYMSSRDEDEYSAHLWYDEDGGTITWGTSSVTFTVDGESYQYDTGANWRYIVW